MNTFSKYLLILTVIFLILVVLSNLNLVNAEIETSVIVNGSKYADEPIEISITPSGSKALNGVDNLVGAKNKLVTLDNKDKYVINHYKDDNNNTYQLIFPKLIRTLNMENTNAKRKIEEILKDVPYHYYYNDNVAMGAEPRCGKTFFNELRQKELNCSDKAPHQEEIEALHRLGLNPSQICKVLEAKYCGNSIFVGKY